jgi:hypothetical protein
MAASKKKRRKSSFESSPGIMKNDYPEASSSSNTSHCKSHWTLMNYVPISEPITCKKEC